MVRDKGTQFENNKIYGLLEDLYLLQHFTLAEHPQTNGQAKLVNSVLPIGFSKALDNAKELGQRTSSPPMEI